MIAILVFLVPGVCKLAAQVQRIMHQDFEVGEATQLQLELCHEFIAEPWVGNNVLVETTVRIDEGSESILKYHIEKGRYKIVSDTTGGVFRLNCEVKDRKLLGTGKGAWNETVVIRVFVPESFSNTSGKTWNKSGPLPVEMPAVKKGGLPD